MNKIRFLFILFIFITASQVALGQSIYGQFHPSKLTEKVELVKWDSAIGQQRLFATPYNDFYQLVQFYVPQENPLYCGVASSVIVLNALRKPHGRITSQKVSEVQFPKVWGSRIAPFDLYTQQNFFTKKTNRVKQAKVIGLKNITPENTNDKSAFDPGLSLTQLAGVLKAHGLSIKKYHANSAAEFGVSEFRKSLKKVLKDKNRFLLANWKRQIIGDRTSGGGHISPIAAYDEATDSILVLDVASHKVPWYWAPVEQFYAEMHTKDGNKYRGYLIVSE